jgi:acyl-CoA thioester hydrolase
LRNVPDAADQAAHAAGVVALRVRYPETDRMRVAYHAHYLVWFEIGRTELMRALGCAYGELEDRDGIAFPLTEVGARYLAPARYDDLLDVHTRLVEVGAVRVRFEYQVVRPSDGKVLATGHTEHAALARDGRPRRMPAELRARLEGRR